MFSQFYNICNLDRIYNAKYEYSLPKKVLESFISGKAFDHPREYSLIEQKDLQKDILDIYRKVMSANSSKKTSSQPLAIMTAGAPGSGKTTVLRQDLEKNKSQGILYPYICPDDICLKNQTRTYQKDIQDCDQSFASRQNAYNKWRPGSNAATHLILGNLIREKSSFYFGTTSTGPATGKFLEFLKKQGYQIRILYVAAPDDIRWESLQERDKTFIQTTKQDVVEKGFLLPQRINDTFLAHADEIAFYYRDGVHKNANLTALWTRNTTPSETLGTLKIFSPIEYTKIKKIHNVAVKALKRPDLEWETSIEKKSKILS